MAGPPSLGGSGAQQSPSNLSLATLPWEAPGRGDEGLPSRIGGVLAVLGTRPLQQLREVVLPCPFGDGAGEMLRPGAKETGESGLSEGPHDQSVYWEKT